MKLCDLHTHVLPGVDDGAPNIEYALQMLRNAVASDVAWLAVTPHYNGSGRDELQDLPDRFLQLRQAAEDIPVELVMGAEVWVSDGVPSDKESLPTIHGSRYLLTEFSVDTKETGFLEILQSLLKKGYIPLVAHPERYDAVCQRPQMVMQWLEMGCHLQLTGGSILGEYGKAVRNTAEILLQNDLVACVASDAHGVNHRNNFLLDVYDHLHVWYSRQYANCLMYENPMRICHDDDL